MPPAPPAGPDEPPPALVPDVNMPPGDPDAPLDPYDSPNGLPDDPGPPSFPPNDPMDPPSSDHPGFSGPSIPIRHQTVRLLPSFLTHLSRRASLFRLQFPTGTWDSGV